MQALQQQQQQHAAGAWHPVSRAALHAARARRATTNNWRPSMPQQHNLLAPRYSIAPQQPPNNSNDGKKDYDVVGLSNLCLDVILPVDELPPPDPALRERLLDALTADPPSQESWEVGGNCNFLIAAARLGMKVGSVGHLGGADVYGAYMHAVLQRENIARVERLTPPSAAGTDLDRTLLCFVLIDPAGRHAFCSRYDFGPWPLLGGVSVLPRGVSALLARTRALFFNGFVFDELPLELIQSAAAQAGAAGAAVFFDPGPRCFTMRSGGRRAALEAVLDLSDVVLMTAEEAEVVTGTSDPAAAAEAILRRPGAKTEWCVVKLGAEGALLMARGAGGAVSARAIRVDVKDTVGCGDSFAAAVVLGYTRAPRDLPSTLVLANAVGAATATGRGAGTNVATADAVLRLLRRAEAEGAHEPSDVKRAIKLLKRSLSSSSQEEGGEGSASTSASASSSSATGAALQR